MHCCDAWTPERSQVLSERGEIWWFFSFARLYFKNVLFAVLVQLGKTLNKPTLVSTQYLQALNKLLEEMSCPKRVTYSREVPLFSAGKRGLVTTGSAGRPRYPGFQAKRSGNNGCLWLGNIGQEMKGCREGGMPGGADKRYLALLHIDLVGHWWVFFLNGPHLSSAKFI